MDLSMSKLRDSSTLYNDIKFYLTTMDGTKGKE